jgi:hypothetical protein
MAIYVLLGRLRSGGLSPHERVSAIRQSVEIPLWRNDGGLVERFSIGRDIWRRLGRSSNGDEARGVSTKADGGPWIETPS